MVCIVAQPIKQGLLVASSRNCSPSFQILNNYGEDFDSPKLQLFNNAQCLPLDFVKWLNLKAENLSHFDEASRVMSQVFGDQCWHKVAVEPVLQGNCPFLQYVLVAQTKGRNFEVLGASSYLAFASLLCLEVKQHKEPLLFKSSARRYFKATGQR